MRSECQYTRSVGYKCYNCDEYVDVPDFTESVSEATICPNCNSDLHLEIYYRCTNCSYYYCNSFSNCPYCQKPREERVKLQEINYTQVTTKGDYGAAIAFISEHEILGLDTEGNSLDPFENELLLVQIGDETHVYVFDYHWYRRLAKELFWMDSWRLWLLQNAKYDYKVLKQSLGVVLLNVFDTFLAERILTCGKERRNSLKELTEKYLQTEMDKTIREAFYTMTIETFDQKVTSEMLEYSARDVQVLPLIYRRQKWELQNNELTQLADLEFDVCKVVAEMELRGIYVNVWAWREIIVSCELQKKQVVDEISELLGGKSKATLTFVFEEPAINLNSTKVLKQIFSSFGITVSSTGDAELAKISHPLAELLRKYRKYEKQLSSFGESFLAMIRHETSRVHPSFQQIGADTGRFSCNKPNLQQIPVNEAYRKCFCAPQGRKIIACDYSQQELRILASLSGDPKFIKFYEDGVDLHTATASMMFNIPMEQVEKDKHRKIAKTINFGLAYGQGAKNLGETIGVDEQEATRMIDKYFAQFTYIRDWLEQAAVNAQRNGYLKTLLNRKRFYEIPEKWDRDYRRIMSSIGRKGKNTPIQGIGVDMIKMALVKIHQRLQEQKLDAFLINVVHDEIVVEASERDAVKVGKIVKEAMEEALSL